MTRQKAELDIKAEEFVEVCYDIEYQKSKFSKQCNILEKLAEYKTKDVHLEIGRMVTNKILVIDPREMVYLRYCRRDSERGT